jgi:ABC-type transport system involved in multi-copper enzyme maturation permease subunit
VTGLLRADVIRLRGRLDVWIVALAVPVIAAFGFVGAYFDVPHHFGYSTPLPPPEIVAAIAEQRSAFAFPQSLMTMLDSAVWVIVAAFFLAATTIGGEYAWGTIRTSLLASSERRRFLASRLVALDVVGTATIALLLIVGTILPIVIAAGGNELPTPPPLQIADLGLAVLARLLALVLIAGCAALLAIATRNGAFPLLVGMLYLIAETLVANLDTWRTIDALRWVPRSLPLQSIGALLAETTRAARDGPVGTVPIDQNAVVFPLWLSFAVVAGWALVIHAAAQAIFRRSDIRE